MTDAEHAVRLHRLKAEAGLYRPIAVVLDSLDRAIELLEASELPMEIIDVPDWRADADRLADALDQLMAAFGRDWGPAVDALIAHQELVEASP